MVCKLHSRDRNTAGRPAQMFELWIKRSLILAALATGGCVSDSAHRDPIALAEAKAVEFLQREVPAWSRDNGCFSCHNNGDAARALFAATRNGYRIPARVLADTTAWISQPNRWDDNKGDPGFSDKRLATIQFAASLFAAAEAGHVRERRPLEEAARKITEDQDPDGAWHIEPQNAAGSPATYGTTLATYLALQTLKKANAPGTSDAIQKAEGWLSTVQPVNIPVAATLLLASRDGSNQTVRSTREKCLNLIRRAQTSDGGWGPYVDSPSEPFDTAMVLLALAEFRQQPGIDELIVRGRSFLVARQNLNGSWPATTRPPGGDSYAQRISTSGWVTLALLRTKN